MLKIQSITDPKFKAAWNNAAQHPLQTWEWGEVKELSGNQIMRVAEVTDSGEIKRVYLFTIHALPMQRFVANYAKGVWPSAQVLQYVHQCLGKKLLLIKLEPELFLTDAGRLKVPLAKKSWHREGLSFHLSASPIFARYTFLLDLQASESELLSGMKSKTRYNISLARRKGVKVVDETDNPEGFNLFFGLYQETVKRQNYLGHGESYHKQVWELMKAAKMARILVAYYENQPLASYTLFFFKRQAYYLYGGSSEAHKEVMGSNLLMWEAILLAKKEGCEMFDLWGALEKNYPTNHPWAGFHRFKEGYGGMHTSYLPTIDVVFNLFEYRIFSFLWPLRIWALEQLNRLKPR